MKDKKRYVYLFLFNGNMLAIFLIYFSTTVNFLVAISIEKFISFTERPETNEHSSISDCIVEVFKRELFWRPTVVFKTENLQSESKNDFINDVIEKLMTELVPFIKTDNIENRTVEELDANCLVIAYYEDCDKLADFDFKLYEKNVKYLILLQHFELNVCKRNFNGIGDIIGRFDISFFVKYSNDLHRLYTYIPEIDSQTCNEVVGKPVHINTCENGTLAEREIFPLKNPINMNKCPIKVGMGSLYPFSTIENKSSLRNNDYLDVSRVKGMDIEMIKISVKYFNATLDLRYIFKLEENAFLYMDFVELVWNGSLEICAGGLYRIYGDSVEYSGVYARQTVTWMYSVERPPKTWQNLAMTVDGLYLFLIFYLSYSIVWYLICIFDEHAVSLTSTLLHGWGALVGAASLHDARTLKQKTLNLGYLIMCLHLSVYISIQLYSFLTIHGPPDTFKTNEGVMKSGKVPYLNALTKYFVNDERYTRFANTSMDCDSFVDCAIQSMVHKGMTLVILGFAYNFQAETAVNDEAKMLMPAEHLLTVYYEMLIRKQHPLVVKFQALIKRLFEAGITDKLYNEAIGLRVVGKAKIAAQNIVANSYSCQSGCSISMEQFGGVLYILIVGCAVSCLMFIVELLSKRRVT